MHSWLSDAQHPSNRLASMTALTEFRLDPNEALEVIRGFWPARGLSPLASVMSKSVSYAHSQSDACWSVTLFKHQVTLNVGQVRVLDADDMHLTLYLEGPTGIPRVSGVEPVSSPKRFFYAALDVPCFRVLVNPKSLSSLTPAILARHHRLIASAAAAKRVSPFKRSYSPGILELLRRHGSEGLEHPSWYKGNTQVPLPPRESPASPFGSPETNPIVEKAAVDHVTTVYRNLGWTVTSVEKQNIGYDLRCERGGSERDIEVKGLSGEDLRFVITSNEHDESYANSDWRLAVVSNALSAKPILQELSANSYQKQFVVRPLTYVAEFRPTRSRT